MVDVKTLNGIELFKTDILNSFVLHIPHASIHIPSLDGFILDRIEENINLLTDWATDKIFDVKHVDKIITPYSRLFCDVERLADGEEPLFTIGRGFYYTNGYDGGILRHLDPTNKDFIHKQYYIKHHELFANIVKNKLDKYGVCYIIDCHSFNDNPVVPFVGTPESPDICIGTDSFHTPKHFLDYTYNYFKNIGYCVQINSPYSGAIVPKDFYKKDKNVASIMIEINKRLYIENGIVIDENVTQLNKLITQYFKNL